MALVCNVCGNEFTARRGAKYCSPRCRTEAHRVRHGLKGKPVKRRPLADAWQDHAWRAMRQAETLERLAEDDRFARNAKSGALTRGEITRTISILNGVLERLGDLEQ